MQEFVANPTSREHLSIHNKGKDEIGTCMELNQKTTLTNQLHGEIDTTSDPIYGHGHMKISDQSSDVFYDWLSWDDDDSWHGNVYIRVEQ